MSGGMEFIIQKNKPPRNSGKPSSEEIKEAIGQRIAEGSVFQCDGEKAYNALIAEKGCTKIVLNSHKDYNKVYHLNGRSV